MSFGKEPKDPSAFAPAGGETYNGKAPWVSSGLYLGVPLPGPHSYSLKFTKAGTFHYLCVLHDIVGMKGTITVAAAPAQATPPPTSTEPIRPATNSDDAGLAVLLLAGLVGLCGATVLIRRRTRVG